MSPLVLWYSISGCGSGRDMHWSGTAVLYYPYGLDSTVIRNIHFPPLTGTNQGFQCLFLVYSINFMPKVWPPNPHVQRPPKIEEVIILGHYTLWEGKWRKTLSFFLPNFSLIIFLYIFIQHGGLNFELDDNQFHTLEFSPYQAISLVRVKFSIFPLF